MKVLPKIPKSLQEVQETLNGMTVVTNKNEQFLLKNDVENNLVIFSCETNFKFLCKSSSVYVDGTFKYCTKFFYQLFTIHGLENEHYIPLVFILLPNKEEKSYITAFKCVKEESLKLNLDFNPTVVFADFEKAIHNGVREIFPFADIKGCRFHLGQSW